MSDILYMLAGALAGALAAWFFARLRAERALGERLRDAEGRASASEALVEELRAQSGKMDEELSRTRTELEAERNRGATLQAEHKAAVESLKEQKALLETMKQELSNTFVALSSAALKSSNEEFLRLATEHLGKVNKETEGKLGEHKASMDAILKPLSESLKKYEENIRSIELRRKQEYTSLDEQIKMLAGTHRELQRETGNLVAALRKPHIRGRWGEVTLKNVVELAGMSSHCDFTEQVSISSEQGRLRPDMVIHLPGGRDIAVDSKVSLEGLLDSASAGTEEEKRAALKRHSSHVKEHISSLSSKAYWSQFSKSPEFVVLFLGEAALAAAMEADSTLMETSLAKKVLISTPTTLFALLTAVAYGWRQEQVTKNAEAIASLGRELFERVSVWVKHLNEVGAALERATEAYNRSVGSMESRVLPSVRKFKDLGTTGAEDIPELRHVDQSPRSLDMYEGQK